ncbi:Hypothetical protein D9617_5g071030 [Elsinoe fawcettii]|nr:Hypothetical protein D9617_5g071030 [Elsinoe fawcettii]
MRCVRTGRQCPGYDTADGASPSNTLISRSGSVTPSVTESIWQSETEWRAFQFFRECTAHQFQSFWPEDIWTDSISQVAHYEPGIRYALLALAGFHERYELNDGVSTLPSVIAPKSDWALTQYNNAIGSFLAPRTDGPVDIAVYLLSCVIFTAIESMRGNSASAIHLVRQGVRMLKEYKSKDQNVQANSSIPLQAIENIFLRWEIQIQELMSDLFGDQGYEYGYQLKDADKNLPGMPDVDEKLYFHSVREARETQDRYWHGLISHLNKLDLREDDQVAEDRAKVLAAYFHISTNLDVAFQDLADRMSGTPVAASEIRGIQVMKMWRLVFQASLANPEDESADSPKDLPSPGEKTLSAQDKLFEEIVDLAESLLISVSQTAHNASIPPPPIVASKKWASLSPEFESPSTFKDHAQHDSIPKPEMSESRHDSLASNVSRSSSTSGESTPDASSTPRPPYQRQRSYRQSSVPRHLPPTFAPDIAMLPTLFGSFLRGNDPTLRRRVINILKTCRRQEGLWDSRLFARICERILELEAEGDLERAARFSTTNSSREASADIDAMPGASNAADQGEHNPYFSIETPDNQPQSHGLGLDLSNSSDPIHDTPDSPVTPEGAMPNLRALGVFRLDPPGTTPPPNESLDSSSQPMPNMRALGSYSLVADEIDEDKGGTKPGRSRETSRETSQEKTQEDRMEGLVHPRIAEDIPLRTHEVAATIEAAQEKPEKKKRPAGWGQRNGGRKVTGVKIGLGAEGLGRQRLRIGFIFDGGRGVREEGLEVGDNGDWVLSGREG